MGRRGEDAGGFENYTAHLNAISAVPEPATWVMMILGFAAIGLHRASPQPEASYDSRLTLRPYQPN
jgi:hypothetical protein